MNCRNCGSLYADTAEECSQCGFPKTTEDPKTNSTLLEFPVSSRLQNENGIPDWRAEVAARVRASRANRSSDNAHSFGGPSGTGVGTAVAMAVETRPKMDTRPKAEEKRPSNVIVEAALRRLQRAMEAPAATATVRVPSPKKEPKPEPKIERKQSSKPDKFVQPKLDLKPGPLIDGKVNSKPQISLEPKVAPRAEPIIVRTEPTIERSTERSTVITAPIVLPAPEIPPPPASVKNEIITDPLPEKTIPATMEQKTPLLFEDTSENLMAAQYGRDSLEYDYQADLVSSTSSRLDPDAQLDKLLHLGADEFDDTARVGQRFVAAVVDAGIVLLTTIPFAVALRILHVNFSDPRVLYVLGGLFILAGFLYSVLSVGLASRTVGMTFTGIRVMSLKNGKQPSLFQATARTIGHLLSAAPLAMGFLWIVLGAERRAWHDMLSGTSVVRDY